MTSLTFLPIGLQNLVFIIVLTTNPIKALGHEHIKNVSSGDLTDLHPVLSMTA